MTVTGCATASRRTNPPPLDRDAYRRRNRIERFFSKLEHYRAIATRHEKHDTNVLALAKLAATRIWLRVYTSVSWRRVTRFRRCWRSAGRFRFLS